MTRDQLRLQLASAVERHARTLQDHGGRAGPALLDDLEQVAEEHARQHALRIEESHRAEQAAARREVREQPAALPVVAANTAIAGGGGAGGTSDSELLTVTPGRLQESRTVGSATPSARTRARTRGGPK